MIGDNVASSQQTSEQCIEEPSLSDENSLSSDSEENAITISEYLSESDSDN